MLVFTRKRGDAVAIGDERGSDQVVKVTVLEVRGLQVKLGFEAANHIAVHRWEVWERICSESLATSLLPAAVRQMADPESDGG